MGAGLPNGADPREGDRILPQPRTTVGIATPALRPVSPGVLWSHMFVLLILEVQLQGLQQHARCGADAMGSGTAGSPALHLVAPRQSPYRTAPTCLPLTLPAVPPESPLPAPVQLPGGHVVAERVHRRHSQQAVRLGEPRCATWHSNAVCVLG